MHINNKYSLNYNYNANTVIYLVNNTDKFTSKIEMSMPIVIIKNDFFFEEENSKHSLSHQFFKSHLVFKTIIKHIIYRFEITISI